MRKLIAFSCAGQTLAGTLDTADGTTGLLIVSGGNEIRIGAHRGMALLATDVAAAGHPVLRFDRRGIGDSTGPNLGFEASGEDIAAAVAAFRAAGIERILAFGNCDAASALALHGVAGIDALVLANPWVIEATTDALPPAAAIRTRYVQRLRDPKSWLRLVRGGVDLRKLAQGLAKVSKAADTPAGLAGRLASGMAAYAGPIAVLLARQDNTAIAFNEAWQTAAFDTLRARVTLHERDTASHSFHTAEDKAWLRERLLENLLP